MSALRNKGMALVTTVMMLPIMVILGFCITRICTQNGNLSVAGEFGQRAEYVAEAGATEGLQRLRDTTGTYGATWAGSFSHTPVVDTSISAAVTVTNNYNGSSTLYAANGASVPPGTAYILSVASTADGRTTRSTGVLVKLSGGDGMFSMGALALGPGITASSNVFTDSYKSSEGLYDTVNATTGVLNRYSNGSLGTNGNLSLDSNEHINGNVKVGGGVSGSTSGVNGTITYGASTMTADTVDCTYTSPNMNTTGVTLGPGATWTYNATTHNASFKKKVFLAPGNYYFNNLSADSNSELVVSGETKIYLTGTCIFDSNVKLNNSTKIPSNFQIFSSNGTTGGDGALKLTSNIDFFGTIFCPNGKVNLDSNVVVFGAIVAKSLVLDSNTKIHYDESLNETGALTVTGVNFWQRF